MASYGRLKTKENSTLSSKCSRGLFQEVQNIMIWLKTFGILENWSLGRDAAFRGGKILIYANIDYHKIG